jgi:hypothetical protein
MHEADKQQPGSQGEAAVVLHLFTWSAENSVTQCASETDSSSPSVCWILKATNWKHFLPRLLHTVVEVDSDYRAEFF